MRETLKNKDVGGRKGFRWRGGDVSRIEGFSDAVFAFALTLLVVSLEVPRNFEGLVRTMEGFPAFGVSFVFLMGIWYVHYTFFRRYGLEDATTMVLNAVLMFVVLFYIYPLKFLFTLLINGLLLNGVLGWDVHVGIDFQGLDMSALMLIYGAAFLFIFLIIVLLHVHALRQREVLALNDVEVFETYDAIFAYGICVVAAVLSMGIALLGWKSNSPWYPMLSGMTYALIGPAQGLLAYLRSKKRDALMLSDGVGF
ncbi:MAG: TMEM175 family protein [Candidatus Latescibacterota bacterium]|jgi:hypothetical protein